MSVSKKSAMTLRLELFVDDLPTSLDFYRRVLRFETAGGQTDGYTPITNGEVHLGLNLRSNLPDDHPIQTRSNERLGRGVEIVLEVDDIKEIYRHVLTENWLVSDQLEQQPWGLTDFRVLDPDGYYLRITSRLRQSS